MPEPRTFRTLSVGLAAYLHASRSLEFLRAEPHGDGRFAELIFADPGREGQLYEAEYDSGAVCPANRFYDSFRYLRRVMEQAKRDLRFDSKNGSQNSQVGGK